MHRVVHFCHGNNEEGFFSQPGVGGRRIPKGMTEKEFFEAVDRAKCEVNAAWIGFRALTKERAQNFYSECSEQAYLEAYERYRLARQRYAELLCPFKVGDMVRHKERPEAMIITQISPYAYREGFLLDLSVLKDGEKTGEALDFVPGDLVLPFE